MHPTSLLLAVLAFAASLPAAARGPAPAPHCMDARQLQEVRQAGARTLAIAQDDGARFRVELGEDCPAVSAARQAQVLAHDGWVCGAGNEYVRVAGQACRIAGVAAIDAREYAALARSSDRTADGVTTLDAVAVTAERRRGFAGSVNYCFAARHMRGWSEDGEGLIVEVSPRRSGGHRYYRVELGRACPELSGAPGIRLGSGSGNGVVCGNPGDHVFPLRDAPGGILADEGDGAGVFARPGLLGASRFGCPVAAVYPLPKD